MTPTVNGIPKYLKYQVAETRLERGVIFKLEYRFPTNSMMLLRRPGFGLLLITNSYEIFWKLTT